MSRTRTITLTVGSLAAGAMLATGVTGMALADDSTSSPSSSASAPGAPGSGVPGQDGRGDRGMRGGPGMGDHGMRGGPGMGDRGMRGGPGGEALHGELVVKAADGTISTVRQIRGTVTAVSASSITVTAEDGYTATFAVTSDTEVHVGLPDRSADPATDTDAITDVAVGDVARVHGTVSGSAATAAHVMALTADEAAQLEQLRQQHAQDRAAAQGTTPGSATGSGSTQAG